MSDDGVKTCQECGASIYEEHLERGKAGFWAGKMLCPVCLSEKRRAEPTTPQASPAPAGPESANEEEDIESIALVTEEEAEVEEGQSPQITAFGGGIQTSAAVHASHDKKYHRPLNLSTTGATRCRTFHAKLSDAAIAYMNEQINEWCDSNPQVDIKFSTSAIGVFEGKHAEPHLILTVFY